ncbi:MAG: ABC transporter substrate-binding protein [Ignavibacteriaceae bacterium]
MIKKYFNTYQAFALIILLIIFVSGCSKQENSKKTKVIFWHSFVATTIPALNELIDRFEKEHPDIDIDAQYIPTGDALVQKLITAIQSKTAPDVSWIHADFLDKLIESDAIYPIQHFIKKANGLSEAEMDDFFPQLLGAFSHKKVLYALPMDATVLALVYNKDHFRAAGIDPNLPPKTWNDLKEYSKKLTLDKDGDGKTDQYGFYVPAYPGSGPLSIWEVLQWSPYLWQAGGEIIDSTQTKVLFNSEAGVQALTLWKEIYDQLNFSNYSFTHDMGLASGSISMIMDGPWDLPTFRKMKNIDWAVASLPEGPKGKATYIAGESLAIFKQSKVSDAAWIFVKWVTQPEIQEMFSISSGYLPVRKSVLKHESYKAFLETDLAMKSFVEQIKIARQRPTIDRYYVNINQFIAEAIEQTLIGNRSPKQTLNEAAVKSNKLLNQK